MSEAQYLKAQQRVAQTTSALGGVGSLAGQWSGMVAEAKNINTDAARPEFDAQGKPLYNLGKTATDVAAINPQAASANELISGTLQGASAGAAFGLPGVLVGAAAGAWGTRIAGGIRKRKMDAKKRLAQGNLFAAQQLYNAGLRNFNQTQIGQSSYNDLLNTQNRIQNLYTFN